MSTPDHDCSLDLHEALQLLELMFFTFERADNSQDWFTMRAPIGSGIYAVERILRQAAKIMDEQPLMNIQGRRH